MHSYWLRFLCKLLHPPWPIIHNESHQGGDRPSVTSHRRDSEQPEDAHSGRFTAVHPAVEIGPPRMVIEKWWLTNRRGTLFSDKPFFMCGFCEACPGNRWRDLPTNCHVIRKRECLNCGSGGPQYFQTQCVNSIVSTRRGRIGPPGPEELVRQSQAAP